MKEFVMVHVTCATKYQYKTFLDDSEIFHQVLSDVNPLILVLVLKDSLRTKFKSLSLPLQLVSLVLHSCDAWWRSHA